MKFIYQARNKDGKLEKGMVEASSREAAAVLLQKYNILVTSLKEIKTNQSFFKKKFFKKKISQKDLAIFSRQLAIMLDSRVPVIQGLLSLASEITKNDFKDKIIRIAELVEEGNSLSESFASFPDVFDIFYTNLIKSGEASGKISESFFYLSDHLERQHDIGSKIKGAMIYPAIVLSGLAVVTMIVMVVVMPKLITVIKDIGGEIPLTTRVLISFYNFLMYYGWIILIAVLFFVIFLIYYFKTIDGRKIYDKMIIRIPFVNELLKKIFLIDFAENLSTLIAAGLPIVRALKITKDIINNFIYREIIGEIEKDVSEGAKISSVLVRYPQYVPSFVVQMVKVGEETGKLNKSLMEIVNFYQKEINKIIDNFMTIIEPVFIIILGAAVALLAISVLSPMYGMLGAL